jgi:hypothetical protein
VQIPAVRLKGVGGKPALDGKVVEIPAYRGFDRCQLSTNQLGLDVPASATVS